MDRRLLTVGRGKKMDQNKRHEGTDAPNKGKHPGFDKDQPQNPGGQPGRDRSQADDEGLRRRPLDAPASPDDGDPDRPGAEPSKHTEATMPPGEGQNPKRRTM